MLSTAIVVLAPAVAAGAQLGNDDAIHIANRLAFGGNLDDRIQIRTNYSGWLNAQLHPTTIPDPDVDMLFPPGFQIFDSAELQRQQFARALISNRRLQEVMTYFWERHFNTSLGQVANRIAMTYGLSGGVANGMATQLEWLSNAAYRANALTSFRNLLLWTSLSPAMLLYLDGDANRGCGGNENYGREFLELFTMGHRNASNNNLPNYSQADVVSAAGCFSGWILTLANWPYVTFSTDAADHCQSDQTLLGTTIFNVGNGSNQLVDLVYHAAGHPATKDFMCRKLMRFFLSEAGGSTALLNQMTAAWGNDGNLPAVLGALFTSAEFLGTANRWALASTPFERVVMWQRVWNGSLRRADTLAYETDPALVTHKVEAMRLAAMSLGENLFFFPAPDGYSGNADEQISASAAFDSWNYRARIRAGIYEPEDQPGNFYPDDPTVVLALVTGGSTNAVTVATRLLEHLYGANPHPLDVQQVTNAIGPGALNPANAFDYAARCADGAAAAGTFVKAQLK